MSAELLNCNIFFFPPPPGQPAGLNATWGVFDGLTLTSSPFLSDKTWTLNSPRMQLQQTIIKQFPAAHTSVHCMIAEVDTVGNRHAEQLRVHRLCFTGAVGGEVPCLRELSLAQSFHAMLAECDKQEKTKKSYYLYTLSVHTLFQRSSHQTNGSAIICHLYSVTYIYI